MKAEELLGKAIVGKRFIESGEPCYALVVDVVSWANLPTELRWVYDSFKREKIAILEGYHLESKRMVFPYRPDIARFIIEGLESGELKEIDLETTVKEGMKIERVLQKPRTGPAYSEKEEDLRNLIGKIKTLPVGESVPCPNLSDGGARGLLKRLERFSVIESHEYVARFHLGTLMILRRGVSEMKRKKRNRK